MKLKSLKRIASVLTMSSLIAISGACSLLGLEDDDDDNTLALAALFATQGNVVTGTLTSNTTLTDGTVLSGIVIAASGVTVTVPAGATVRGLAGSALIISAGATINAVGTSTSPIVFTSSKDAGSRAPGDWGGIVLIGNAPNTRSSVQAIEGGVSINYGGSAANNSGDSSGSMQYVRIEFAGNEVSPGDELNCLSMYGVGSGTTLSHIQCHMGKDDAFEWFGGSVNAKYLLGTGTADDDFDMDEGFGGTLQYIISHKYTAAQGVTHSSDPHGMEMDGSHSTGTTPTGNAGYSNPTVRNFSLFGAGITGGFGMRLREGITGNFQTGVMYNFAAGSIRCDSNTSSNTAPTITMRTQTSSSDNLTCNTAGITQTKDLNAQPYTSAGDVANNTAPDYTSTAGTTNCGSTSAGTFLTADTTCGGMTSTSGNWASGWTFYTPN